MACRVLQVGDAVAIICGRNWRTGPCSVCRAHVGDKLCDGPAPSGSRRRTCSARICACCAVTRPNPKKPKDTLDYCPRCAKRAPPEQLGLGSKP